MKTLRKIPISIGFVQIPELELFLLLISAMVLALILKSRLLLSFKSKLSPLIIIRPAIINVVLLVLVAQLLIQHH